MKKIKLTKKELILIVENLSPKTTELRQQLTRYGTGIYEGVHISKWYWEELKLESMDETQLSNLLSALLFDNLQN